MEAINIMFIFFIIVGFVLIIYALFQAQKNINEKSDIFTIEEGINKIKSTIDEADKTIDELNSLAEQIFLQFDEKKKELLFLYDMIEKKQQDITSKVDIVVDKNTSNSKNTGKKAKKTKKYENPLLKQILEMEQKGMTIGEISKNLNIGQGEVELILTLGKE